MTWNQVIDHLQSAYKAYGLDLFQPFDVLRYNERVEPTFQLRGCETENPLGILIGNTGKLWPHFIRWLAADEKRLLLSDPLDAYVEDVSERILSEQSLRIQVWYSHNQSDRRFAAQKLAELSGLAWQSPAYLSIHPELGPWLSIRVALVIDEPVEVRFAPPATDPCGHCQNACLPALKRALELVSIAPPPELTTERESTQKATVEVVNTQNEALASDESTADEKPKKPGSPTSEIAGQWQAWLAVRDACPLGKQHRFSPSQLAYHYQKDHEILRQEVASLARRSAD